jgi:hypothetical protein
MAVCCQNLTLGALSSRSALSLLVGALFKKFGVFLNTPYIYMYKNMKEKMYKSNAAIRHTKTCWHKQQTPNSVSSKLNGNTRHCQAPDNQSSRRKAGPGATSSTTNST